MTTPARLDLAGDGFFHFVDLLDTAKAGLPAAVPAPVDERFSELARAYRKADAGLRQQVRDQIPAEYWAPLLSLGDRCAEWALADRDPRHIEDGLTAYCIQDFRLEEHENFVHLSMLWYAAKSLHTEIAGLFNQIGRFGSPRGLQGLSDFSAKPESATSPWSMGLETYDDGGHTRFRARHTKSAPAK
jgi:hypothetical protein